VTWADANRDGWLDLVGVAADAETRVYTNFGGVLETTASWQTTDSAGQDAIMAVSGDVTGDGLADLIVTNNIQLGDSGRFRQYDGVAGGLYQTTYGWSFDEGYGSALALADIDGDGDLDLATGAWWDFTRVFLNDGSGLGLVPQWSSAVSTVIEKIAFGDLARDSLQTAMELFPASGDRLFHLAHRPVQEVVAVRRDGVLLGPDEFLVDRDDGWVTTSVAPVVSFEVEYRWSRAPDMAVTNWDDDEGNFVYVNRLNPGFSSGFESGDLSEWSAVVSGFVVGREAAEMYSR
jgi:hypothetical protein